MRCSMKNDCEMPHMPQVQSGFTLVELLLYVSISSILLLVLSLFLSILLESRVKSQIIAEVDQQGAQVVQIITQAVRNATGVNIPVQGSSASTLSVSTYDAGLNPTVFDLSGGEIRMTEGVGSVVKLTNTRVTANGLMLTNLSRTGTPGVIRIQFTLTYVNNSGRNEYNYTRTFYASASLRQP